MGYNYWCKREESGARARDLLIFSSRCCSAGRVRSCKLQQSMVRVRAEIAIPIPILVNKTNINHINKNMKLS